ncbi:UrcA family protein [Altererythrobacter confluentis]|uniref:UrcA family protein n=1 Tax=Allopontixanthobacter confluentis TaxID=1849021 RepID=A0A6L7GIF5_9SPHN|nr:UrcA family protein [Allopontixanthobacter confluentis]MXP15355.1 UrcA family protein [Allopontixanthobacter confluentis]
MVHLWKPTLVIAAGLALAATSDIALAQSSTSQEITVTAPRVSVHKEERTSSGMARVMVYSVDRQVSFGDLDLMTAAGIETFRARIREAAKEGCAQISKDYPLVKDSSCERVAIDQANLQANQIIEAARM